MAAQSPQSPYFLIVDKEIDLVLSDQFFYDIAVTVGRATSVFAQASKNEEH
jgi:hypothetical protein